MSGKLSLDDTLAGFFNQEEMVEEINKQTEKKFWRPKEGKTIIRVLPPNGKAGEKLFYFTHKVHWINKQPYECLDQQLVDKNGVLHKKEKCPICEITKRMRASADEDIQKEGKNLSAKYKYLTRILVRNHDTYDTTPIFYEMPYKIRGKVLSAIQEGDFGTVVGVRDGRDFTLIKEGSGFLTSYDNSMLRPNTSPILGTDEEMIGVIEKIKNMPYSDIISFKEYDELKSVILEDESVMDFLGIKEDSFLSGVAALKKTAPAGKQKTEDAPMDLYTEDELEIQEDSVSSTDLEELLGSMV